MSESVKHVLIASGISARILSIKKESIYFKENHIFKVNFHQNTIINQITSELAIRTLQKMKSGISPRDSRLITLNIAVSEAISLSKANKISSDRQKVRGVISTTVAAPLKLVPYIGTPLSAVAGMGIYKVMVKEIPNAHDGDIIICVEGIVNGGIGQQHAITCDYIQRSVYDPL